MHEVVITIITQETTYNVTYPVTAVRRIEFDSAEALEVWLHQSADEPLLHPVQGHHTGVTNVERLVASA
jgi:hypothetical protein